MNFLTKIIKPNDGEVPLKQAHTGQALAARYDESLKRWIFPGEVCDLLLRLKTVFCRRTQEFLRNSLLHLCYLDLQRPQRAPSDSERMGDHYTQTHSRRFKEKRSLKRCKMFRVFYFRLRRLLGTTRSRQPFQSKEPRPPSPGSRLRDRVMQGSYS